MSKNNFSAILAEKKSLGALYSPNHYEIMGIENFSPYDEKLKIRRIEMARTEIKDDSDQREMKELINNANSILKDANLKAKYDESLKLFLEQKGSGGADQKVGFPALRIENEDSLIFNEVKLDSTITQSIILKNGSGGILNGTITVPKGQNWLDVNPKVIKQSDLPLRVNITINPQAGNFSLSDLKSEVVQFTYRTDNGLKEEKRRIEVRTEGLDKKIQRLSKFSIWIFVGIYAILVGIQTFNNVSTSLFSIKITFLYRILTWASIPLLYLFLRDYNLYGFEKLRNVFRRETFREKLELSTIGLLLFFGFELFMMFAIGIGVLWLNGKVLKTMKIKNGTFYTPFVGLAFYGLLLTQLPSHMQKYTTQYADPQAASQNAPVNTDVYVRILKDTPVRTTASTKGKIVFVAKAGGTYKLASNQLINNEWAQVKYPKDSIEQIGYIRFSNETIQVISN
jgi:hypothetical protein